MGAFSSDRDETADIVCGSQKIDQQRIVASVKEKCELIKYLCSSNELVLLDRVKSDYHAYVVESLISSIISKMTFFSEEKPYLEAAKIFEQLLCKMGRLEEALKLYAYSERRFEKNQLSSSSTACPVN